MVSGSEKWMLKVVVEDCVEGDSKVEYKKRMERERYEWLIEKKLHGKLFREVKTIGHGSG